MLTHFIHEQGMSGSSGGAVAVTVVLLMGSADQIPGWGTQIMQAVQCGQKLKQKTKNREAFLLA